LVSNNDIVGPVGDREGGGGGSGEAICNALDSLSWKVAKAGGLEGSDARLRRCLKCEEAFRDDMFSLSARRVSAMIVRVRRCLRFRELTCKNLRIDCKVELVLGGRGCVVRD
jgi:hypothetical protein